MHVIRSSVLTNCCIVFTHWAYRFFLIVPSRLQLQFETVGMIPKSYFEENQTIYAFTERVIDGDTVRVRHIPGYSLRWLNRRRLTTPLQKRGIAGETLSIRVYGA